MLLSGDHDRSYREASPIYCFFPCAGKEQSGRYRCQLGVSIDTHKYQYEYSNQLNRRGNRAVRDNSIESPKASARHWPKCTLVRHLPICAEKGYRSPVLEDYVALISTSIFLGVALCNFQATMPVMASRIYFVSCSIFEAEKGNGVGAFRLLLEDLLSPLRYVPCDYCSTGYSRSAHSEAISGSFL